MTSPQGVGNQLKIVDFANTDFWCEPRDVSYGAFYRGFRPVDRLEQHRHIYLISPEGEA